MPNWPSLWGRAADHHHAQGAQCAAQDRYRHVALTLRARAREQAALMREIDGMCASVNEGVRRRARQRVLRAR